MQRPYVIGIDIGTGSVKALAVDFNLHAFASSQQFYPPQESPTEQDAEAVFQSFLLCINDLVTKTCHSPAAISLSAAMHSIMAIDKEGNPLTNAMLWSDTRSSEIADGLRKSERGKRIYAATGTPLHSMSPLCKIKWMAQNKPKVFGQAFKFISVKEYIWHKLFNEYKIDYSLASATGLFDIQALQWHDDALAFAGINSQRLSEPVATGYKQANMNASFAKKMNISANTPVYIGASDGCLANLGSLCLDASEAAVTIGTSGAVRVTLPKPLIDTERMIFSYLLDATTFVCGGAINNGGNVLQWLANKFLVGDAVVVEDLFAEAAKVPAGSDGLLFLPYLNGERAPIWDEKSSGVFFGIKTVHEQWHFARAAMEGICFALMEILSIIEGASGVLHKIKFSGAVAKSMVMLQMLADVSGKEVVVHEEGDASALGAAYLALKDLGAIENYANIKPGVSKTIQPDTANAAVYKNRFTIYRTLYPALKQAMHSVHLPTTT